MPAASQFYQERREAGLELWVVLGETSDGTAPDLDYCMGYAESHGISPENLYIDNEGGQAWSTLFQHISPMTQDIGLPWAAIVEGVEMSYVWNTVVSSGNQHDVIDGLLAE